jgi:hypothetical protein
MLDARTCCGWNVLARNERGGRGAARVIRLSAAPVQCASRPVQPPPYPAGALNKVKFPNALPGTKGLKRPPTADELRLLGEAFK